MAAYLLIFLQGALIVAAVSWQTTNLQHGGRFRVGVGAFVVGLLWYQNVGTAADPPTLAWLAYALGSSSGALAGWWIGTKSCHRSVPPRQRSP